MANKPPRKKFPTPVNTQGELNTDETLEDEVVEDEVGTEVESTEEDTMTPEEVEEETPAEEEAVTFNYPTMEDMEKEEEETAPESAVQFTGSVSRKDTPDVLVKVRVAVHKQFVIGGERYDLHPGKIYQVPENVKLVLKENDLLRPL